MLETSLYYIILEINPGYTHLNLYLVFFNLPCITEEKSDYIAFFHLRIACNTPSPTHSVFPASNKMQNDCIQFLLGFIFLQRDIKNNSYANVGGGKGLVNHGEFWVMGKSKCQKSNKFCCYFSWWRRKGLLLLPSAEIEKRRKDLFNNLNLFKAAGPLRTITINEDGICQEIE